MTSSRTPTATPPLRGRLGLGRALRGAGGLARVRPRRPRIRTLLAAGLALALLVAGWSWLRDSSLVTVRDVQITGLSGGQEAEIRRALEEAATSMTTLHVREDELRVAVRPFSIVKDIDVATDFPRAMRIHVVSNVAVGAVELDGTRIPVTADGTLLRDVAAGDELPTVPLHGSPAGSRLQEGEALSALAALGAAPAALRANVDEIRTTRDHGLEVQLANGPVLWLGADERLTAKWAAAAAVLADAASAGASYVDVTAPERPAVGGLTDGAPAEGEDDRPELPDGAAIDPTTGLAVTPPPEATAYDEATGSTVDPATETVP